MKQFLFFIMIFLWGSICSADVMSPASLLNPGNTDLTKSEIKTTFTGTPAVLIEPSKNQKRLPNQAERLPPPAMPKSKIKIPIKTTFGHEQSVSFLDHTTDFTVFVYILNDETVRVEEHIQFITTAEKSKFERIISKNYADLSGKNTETKVVPLSLIPDNGSNSFHVSEAKDTLTMTYPRHLSKGVHRFTVRYLVTGAVQTNHALTDIFLSLSGLNWNQMTERFSVVVFLPKKSTFYTKELLFGSNNQSVPESVSTYTDTVGNVVYQLTRPLPAFADVKLHMVIDSASLPAASVHVTTFDDSYILVGIYMCILALYVVLSVLTSRRKKWKNPLTAAKKVNVKLWQYELKHSSQPHQEKSALFFKAIAFIRFNIEYIVGLILLIGITCFMANKYHVDMGLPFKTVLGISAMVALVMIDHFGTRQELINLKNELKKALLDTPQGLNLAQRDIPTYYAIALHLGFGEEWSERLIGNNPAYQSLFNKKGENT